ncbi:hypothetical protein, partial [Rhizobium sp. PDO1-076]|uniref:hypothetical protein n=1 Tax=Rhizobium sp. PDO1-076 TaxID=1125979 RepID=UPI001AEBDF2D
LSGTLLDALAPDLPARRQVRGQPIPSNVYAEATAENLCCKLGTEYPHFSTTVHNFCKSEEARNQIVLIVDCRHGVSACSVSTIRTCTPKKVLLLDLRFPAAEKGIK